VLVITAFVIPLLLAPTNRANLGKDTSAAALHITNYTFARWQNDYQNLEAQPSPFLHYWSLAVEQQLFGCFGFGEI
jgi:peptidoglycan/LPS O-acetylase OafA/YrhL